MTQRKTQTPAYWQEQFTISDHDIEFIYNQILEENRPLDLDSIAILLVGHHCDEEELATRNELQQGKLYQPKDSYAVNEKIVFPALDFTVGQVKYTRSGSHPEYGTFTVLGVTFGNGDATREFVADFDHPHSLNIGQDQSLANLQGLMSPEELFQMYGDSIRLRVKQTLNSNDDFVEFHDQYFLRDLLPPFQEGLFNIADAAIDINEKPLSADALIEQMGLIKDQEVTDIIRFAVSYRLINDERFDDVGPTGQILWYLRRMEPPETHHQPERLQISDQSYDASAFDEDLHALLAEIDDEGTNQEDIAVVNSETKSITIVLNYPHWRAGTLPVTPKTQSFFPSSYYNPVLFEFVDGRTGNTFPGWTILNNKYVFGLSQWYKKNKLPVGAYIILKRTDDPMQVIIDYQATRNRRDWIRMATAIGNRLSFQMNKEAIGCKYDELMIVGEANPNQIDNLWSNAKEKGLSIYDALCQVFPELSKLNPQSTVHAKTLYSAVNVIRRATPATIFQELVNHRCFIPERHGYWSYDPNLRDD